MTEKRNIYQRIHDIMKEVTYVQKENKKVNNQYTFVSHDAVSSAIRLGLLKHGVVAIPTILDSKQDGNRTTVFLEMSYINIDKPDERVIVKGFGYGIDNQDKGPGKAISYATKYIHLKTFCLETGDDPERDHIDHIKEVDESKILEFTTNLEQCDNIEKLKEEYMKYYMYIQKSVPKPEQKEYFNKAEVMKNTIKNRINNKDQSCQLK